MKILSIDTASNICGVSILEDSKLLIKLDVDTGRTHSENLMPLIEEAFSKTNLTLKDINLCVVDKGPGSFTGIRIGIATAKAFHDSLNIPCVSISSLEALAYNAKIDEGLICSIIDCKNDNCYFALYEKKINGDFNTLIEPDTDSVSSALSIIETYRNDNYTNKNITFIGDGYGNNILDSFNLGLAGLYHYNLNYYDDSLLPLYLKKPQAQRQLEEKNN